MQSGNNELKKNISRIKILEILMDIFSNFKDLRDGVKYNFIYKSIFGDIDLKFILKNRNQRVLLMKIYLSKFFNYA
jgi:hypothetical protein